MIETDLEQLDLFDEPLDGPIGSEDGLTDIEADAMTLRDCGMGTDEDYGYCDEQY